MSENSQATQERIDEQRRIVASLKPETAEHRLATKILLLMQDSLHLLREIDTLIAESERIRNGLLE